MRMRTNRRTKKVFPLANAEGKYELRDLMGDASHWNDFAEFPGGRIQRRTVIRNHRLTDQFRVKGFQKSPIFDTLGEAEGWIDLQS